jgi:hypothetical protein
MVECRIRKMLENSTLTASRRIVRPALSLLALTRRALAFGPRRRPVCGAAILLGVLAAAPVQAQDTSSGVGESAPPERNRIVEIPPNAPEPAPAIEDVANPTAAGEAEGREEGEEGGAEQNVRSSEGGLPKFANLDQFTSLDDTYESPIGALLQHNCTELTHHQVACGLAILEIRPGSPAATAGMRPYSGLVHTLLGATVMSAAMVFPPAIVGLGLVEDSHVGESYDLIIGVDGRRIHSIPDFQDAISNARIGDLIYLTLVRGGKRLQIPIRITQQSDRGQ